MTPPTTSEEIRQAFLDFFEEVGHTVVSSSPLPNRDNPTLLFTNAGMNQFTDIFLGKIKRPYPRAATAQKVMRVQGKQNDLENVGPSPRHQTMFEMMGNFSFGDYFKKEAIAFAWAFATEVMKLDINRLWASIYEDDDESEKLWQKHIPPERILRFDAAENFWEMGETGPCGPCSELHYYIGDLDKQTPAGVNVDDDYLEFWNLVFMQYERQPDKSLLPLPNPSVDTGLGLERMVQIMQGVDNNYDTDLFVPILARIQALLNDDNSARTEHLIGYRVIADHGRAATFLIADGVVPGNTGEGYVLRMIIRRAARFGRNIGFEQPFLAEIAQVVADKMGDVYPEVRQGLKHIKHVLTSEEKNFNRTLDSAVNRLDVLLAELKDKGETTLSGEAAFTLFATYGLPVEITKDIAVQQGFDVDEAGFKAAQEAHAIASGAGRFAGYETEDNVYGRLFNDLVDSGRLPASGVDYDPYTSPNRESEILAIIQDGVLVDGANVDEPVEILTIATPFYVEAGGEVSDTGEITHDSGRFRVDNTIRPLKSIPGLIVHQGEMRQGRMAVGQTVTLQVDDVRQQDIRRNHTATHLLHQALRDYLGTDVTQAGSLVAPDRLRFDFTYDKAVGGEALAQIEAVVNQSILQNFGVDIEYMGQEEAKGQGAIALFGEKYGDIVRTVQIGAKNDKPRYSFELCGGLHVAETGEIGSFYFVSEGAVAAGIRRVEAITGEAAYRVAVEHKELVSEIMDILHAGTHDVAEKLNALVAENKGLRKALTEKNKQQALSQFDTLLNQAREIGGVILLTATIEETDSEHLRTLIDKFREKTRRGVAVLATVKNERPILVAGVTDELVKEGVKAGDIIREMAQIVGGGGGGRPHFAQAGGKNAGKLPEALAAVPEILQKQLQQ